MTQPAASSGAAPPHWPDEPPRHGAVSGKIRVDKTINVANILTMCAIAFGVVSYGMKTYQEVFTAITKSQHDVSNLTDRIARTEANVSQMRIDNAANSTQLRQEIHQDLREMRSTLNTISLRLSHLPQSQN